MYMTKQAIAKKKRLFIRRMILLLGFLAIVFAVLVLFNVIPFTGGAQHRLVPLPLDPAGQWAFAGDSFIYTSGNKLAYYDIPSAKSIWEIDVSASEQQLAMSPNIQLVYNSAAMQMISSNFPQEFSGRVLLVKCGNEYAAALKQEASGSFSMQVFDRTQNQVDQLTFADGQYILDFGFYGPNDALWTLSIDTFGAAPQTTITTYSVGRSRSITGIISVNDQVVERVVFTEQSIFALGTNYLLRYNQVGSEKQYQKLIYGWQCLDFSPLQRPIFLLTPRSTESSQFSILKILSVAEDASLDEESLLQAPTGTLGAFILGGNIVCVTPGASYIYSSKGAFIEQHAFDLPIDGVEKLDDARLLLHRGGERFLLSFG